ncbi:unnamed protein product [Bemisia tabaci]|uniref:Nudix hydrolase domain-containing protein n=2 Tax=Bemisia tabaci TaxID=7038 RepID=A0A9P0ADG0_BEMTA|nr:unnamed protein product [Bemisia tabaci]
MVFLLSLRTTFQSHHSRFHKFFPYLFKSQSSIPIPLNKNQLCTSSALSFRNFSSGRIMSSQENLILKGKLDHYNGMTIDCDSVPEEGLPFAQRLEESLKKWAAENVRGVWFHVSTKRADWIPVLVKNGFNFHHASIDTSTLTLCRWLPQDAASHIPVYAHTMVGIGAVVVNEDNEVLTVKEKYGQRIQWKLPGGYVEPGEDLADAVVREVMEETHIETKFVSLLSLRHMHQAKFGCSDFYFIAHLVPLSKDIKKCDREIEDCVWMKIDEYLNHPEVHINNKFFVQKYVENKKNNVAFIGKKSHHPVTKKEQYIFAIESTQ